MCAMAALGVNLRVPNAVASSHIDPGGRDIANAAAVLVMYTSSYRANLREILSVRVELVDFF